MSDDTGIACWACGSSATQASDRFPPSRLTECRDCGLLFVPEVSASAAREFYDDDYFENYAGGEYRANDAQRHHEAQVRLDWVAGFAPPPGRLLEFGSAAGYFLAGAASRGYEPLGVEPSPRESATATERFGVEVRTGFLDQVELAEGGFDLACGWHVLEHIPEPLSALSALREALCPDGTLFIEVPNGDSPVARRLNQRWPGLDLPEHVSIFSPRSMRALLARAGFAVSALDTVAQYSYFRPRLAWRPRVIVGRLGVSAVTRTLPHGHDPSRHEFLRVVAAPVKVAATASPVG